MDRRLLLKAQKNEMTEYTLYSILAKKTKDPENKKILESISHDELKHYNILKKISGVDVSPSVIKVRVYSFFASFLGFMFIIHLMEKGERFAKKIYEQDRGNVAKALWLDEQKHEKTLLAMLEDGRITYASSVLLGLNDAIVEFSASLSGLTLALGNTFIIGIIGMISGISAAMSMAATEFLSSKEDSDINLKKPAKGAVYTGISYILTVSALVTPYFVFREPFYAILTMLLEAVLIIVFYTFYMSTAKGQSFSRRFSEMIAISLGIAGISFFIGWLVKTFLGIAI